MLEEKVSEERYLELNEEGDIIMDNSKEEQWRGFAKEGDNK